MQDIPAVTPFFLVRNVYSMSDIHARIKDARENLKWSMETLAKEVGVSWQTIQQWENGSSAPKRARLEMVARVLGISSAYLMTGSKEQELSAFDNDVREALGELPPEKRAAILDAMRHMLRGALADHRDKPVQPESHNKTIDTRSDQGKTMLQEAERLQAERQHNETRKPGQRRRPQ